MTHFGDIFAGKTVFITGGAGGIAMATAREMLQLRANVFLTDRDDERLRQARELLGHEAQLASGTADITRPEEVEDLFEQCLERFPGKLFSVVNAAGIFPPAQPVSGMTDAQWREVISVNLDGIFHVCRAALAEMEMGGSIINIASIAGHRGSFQHAQYSASKSAVLGFSRSLAQELAPKIRVNCVSPGPVDTPMIQQQWNTAADKILAATPLQRICTPEEVARAIVFLASDWASYITAETLHVNGGQYIHG